MDYKTARLMIQAGDIIAFTSNGWGSIHDVSAQVIRLATRSEYYHVGLAWPVAGRLMILEAVAPMIRIFPLSKRLPFYWISRNQPMSTASEEFALSRVGEQYSRLEALRGFLSQPINDDKWQCAEYVKSVLYTTGSVFHGKDTPSGVVHDALSQNGIISLVTEE